MNTELNHIAGQLQQAQRPEEVFGHIGGAPAEQAAKLKKIFLQLAKTTHPDAYPGCEDQAAAQAAFNRLTDWYESAQTRIQDGVYGSTNPLDDWRVVLRTRKRAYVLENAFTEGPLYTSYPGSFEEDGRRCAVLLKITRDPCDNDLAENETNSLQALKAGKAVKKFGNYLPRLLDSFLYEDGGVFRQVNVFERAPGWVSLVEVRQRYPRGLDAREVAWIWRRVLVALGFAHLNGRIHGALLPCNIEILPELHGLRLVEWSYSVARAEPPGDAAGECLTALDPAYADWCPGDVQCGNPPLPGMDISMAARCMIELLGGDPLRRTLPASVPQPLCAFFKGSTLPGKRSQPQDAWSLKGEFEDLIRPLWGEQKFQPFVMQPIHE